MLRSNSAWQTWRRIHRWVGLVAGLPIALVAATGLPVSYWYDADALFAPDYYAGTSAAPRASFDTLAAAAQAAVPSARVESVYVLPEYGTAQAAITLPGGAPREVSLDLATGKILGVRSLDDAVIAWLYSLHTRLALDRLGSDLAGKVVVIALALLFLVLAVSGVWLWWPARIGWRALAPRLAPGRRWRDLHNIAGIYALLPLTVAAVTALCLEIPVTRGLGGVVAPTFVPAPPGASLALETLARRGAARHAAPLRGLFDLAELGCVTVLSGDEWGGDRWTVVQRASGVPVLTAATRPSVTLTAPDASFLIGLHQGHRWGRIGQAVVALASIIPVLLYGTGLVLWARTARRARAASRRVAG